MERTFQKKRNREGKPEGNMRLKRWEQRISGKKGREEGTQRNKED